MTFTRFDATREIYDQIGFAHEIPSSARACLEWEGRFAGRDIARATALAANLGDAIESIRLYHRSCEQAISFLAELAGRLTGNVDL